MERKKRNQLYVVFLSLLLCLCLTPLTAMADKTAPNRQQSYMDNLVFAAM